MLDRNGLQALEQRVAQVANDELMPRFLRVKARHKSDGSLITEADLRMQAGLIEQLRQGWPEYAVLGEEMTAERQQALLSEADAAEHGLWVLDPLDGTANFAAGIPFFGVSLALLLAGQIQAGVVYDPVRKESFSALRGQGAWLNGAPLRLQGEGPDLQEAMGMVDLKRLPSGLIQRLAHAAPYRSQRSFGSVALDWCWLAAARVQVYLHGGQKLWDYAAGTLILREAGGCGGLFEDYAGRPANLVLQPRIAIAAVSEPLFTAWDGWIRG